MLSDVMLMLVLSVVALAVRVGPRASPSLPPPGEPGRGAIPSGAEARRVQRAVTLWVGPRGVPVPPARAANLARAPRPVRLVADQPDAASA